MDGHDRSRRFADCAAGGFHIDAIRLGVAVHPDRRGAGERDRTRARNERVGRGDHLVSWTDAHRPQAQLQRRQAGVDADRTADPAVRGELGFERLYVASQNEVAALHYLVYGVFELDRNRGVLGPEVDQRDLTPAHRAAAAADVEGLARSAWARSRMRTIARPSRPSARGRAPVRTHSTKCASSSRSGSLFSSFGIRMSPSLTAARNSENSPPRG